MYDWREKLVYVQDITTSKPKFDFENFTFDFVSMKDKGIHNI